MAPRALRLLNALNGFVAGETAASGLTGHVCVGVRAGDRDYWWHAELTRPEPAFVDEVPPDADAIMLIGELEAEMMLDGDPLPDSPNIIFRGDRELMSRFLKRYLRTQNLLGLRAGKFDI